MDSPDPRTIQLHQPTILSCGEIDSVPPTVYTWQLQGGLDIDVNIDRAIKGSDGQLYLQDPEYNETFICTADNDYTGDSHTGYIKVTVQSELCKYVPTQMVK